MSKDLPVSKPNTTGGGIYSIGYNAWKGGDGLSRMFDALQAERVTILVDTRNSDFRGKYSYDQLGKEAVAHKMKFAPRPVLSGKPLEEAEYTEAGEADYGAMDEREGVRQTLDGMATVAKKGERIALLCACADTCTCHRSRWLGESLAKRGVDVGHIEPGVFDYERYIEEGAKELYSITPHSELPDLPDHSDTNWRERVEYWSRKRQPQPIPTDYKSPQAERPIPQHPTQVLIAGSINANHAQLNYASALVVRAAEIGAQIHVGDNDKGVDARVVETAKAIGYTDVVVWTAGDDPRNGGVESGQLRKVPYNFKEKGNRFTQRDRTMIRGLDDEHGAAFFIDNGFTHHKSGRLTGTEAGYVFAVEQGKAARKASFGRQQDRDVDLKPLPSTYTSQYRPEILGELDLDLTDAPDPFAYHYPPPVSEIVESESDAPKPILRDDEKWDLAREKAEGLAEARARSVHYSGRPGHQGAQVLEVQTLPVADLGGEPLGYAVAAVEAKWRAIPFKIYTGDWRGADTVSVTEVAHFKAEAQAQDYAANLRGFMAAHDLTGDPVQGRDFLHEVGQLNGLRPGVYTTDLIHLGVGKVPNHRAEIGALQADDWELKTFPLSFRPMDKEVPTPEPQPLFGFSLHAVQTRDEAGQPLGYSTVALRDVYEHGIPVESDISQSYAMELAGFDKQEDAQSYADGLTQYIKDKPDLEFIGLPENTVGTQTFLKKVAETNEVDFVECSVDRNNITNTRLWGINSDTPPTDSLPVGDFPTFQNLDL